MLRAGEALGAPNDMNLEPFFEGKITVAQQKLGKVCQNCEQKAMASELPSYITFAAEVLQLFTSFNRVDFGNWRIRGASSSWHSLAWSFNCTMGKFAGNPYI